MFEAGDRVKEIISLVGYAARLAEQKLTMTEISEDLESLNRALLKPQQRLTVLENLRKPFRPLPFARMRKPTHSHRLGKLVCCTGIGALQG